MRDRLNSCIYYTYEGCECSITSKCCHFQKEMQHCQKYVARKGPAKPDTRYAKLARIRKKEENEEY